MQISKKIYTTLIIAVLTMSAIMAAIPMASAEITVAPTLTPTSGPVGTTVNVAAGANGASPFSTVSVYLDALSGAVLGTGSATATGSYSINVTIPATTAGGHYLVVNDGETESNGTIFTVQPRLVLQTVPATFGPGPYTVLPGDNLIVTGDGFAASQDITLVFDNEVIPNNFTITTPAIASDSTGSFSASVFIPTTVTLAQFGLYNVTATDEDLNNATTTVNIDYYILCTPSSGPRGITTTISGRIAPNEAYTIRFNGAAIGSGTTTADGSYSIAYTIPGVLSTTSYPVDILWNLTETRSTTFTVTASPIITVTPTSGIVGATIDVTGSGFIPGANVTLYLGSTVVNSTALGFGPVIATGGSAGQLPADSTFIVPALALGSYAVTVVDQFGATSNTVIFTIAPTPVFMIQTRAMQYQQGAFISLTSMATSSVDCVLTINDPTGLEWAMDAVSAADWQMIGSSYQLPYDGTSLTWFPIPSDAPLGFWNFTCWDIGMTTILDTNLFEVVVLPTTQDVLDQLTSMQATITDLISTSEGNIIAVINTKTGQIMADLSDLDVSAQLTSIDSGIATISTTLGEVKTSVDNLSVDALAADITSIKNGVATIQTNIGTVSTAVSNLDAKLTNVQGDVATVLTNMGTLDGKVTAIDGKVATVQTDVGTIQADVTDVQAKADQTPVWIAVVLSLVAAIAAIFAVITIRQKIAG